VLLCEYILINGVPGFDGNIEAGIGRSAWEACTVQQGGIFGANLAFFLGKPWKTLIELPRFESRLPQ